MIKNMIWCVIRNIGYISSFIYTDTIANKFKRLWTNFYTGWQKRRFKVLDGIISGKITVVGPQYITIGKETIIQERVRLLAYDKFHGQQFTPAITIGDNCVIQKDCFLSAVDKIEIGDRVAVTEHTIILDNVHGDFQENHLTYDNGSEIPDVFLQNVSTRPLASNGPVIIENDVHIGMFCTLLPGTLVGHHSVIAAHSVVARKIPPYSLVAGNPARVLLTFGRKNNTIISKDQEL